MKITKVEHVAIMVADMDISICFYTELLGFKVINRGENERREMAFLVHANQHDFEIELIRDIKSTTSYSESGLVNHLAFTVENIIAAIKHLQKHGVEFHNDTPNTAINGARTIFFNGPNRELLQLVERRKGTGSVSQ